MRVDIKLTTPEGLKAWIALTGRTQKRLANEIGVTDRTISGWLSTGKIPRWLPLAILGLSEEVEL